MKNQVCIQQLLRWRLAQAETEAPPAPRAEQLLEMARPWWETWPQKFQAMAGHLAGIRIAYGHAMAKPDSGQAGHPVAVLVVQGSEKTDASARVLYLSVQDQQLRLRFRLDAGAVQMPEQFEVTFVNSQSLPLFECTAALTMDHDYRIDAQIPPELARAWGRLRVTDRMPFRLMIRPG